MHLTRRMLLAAAAAGALLAGAPALLAADLPEGGTVEAVENTKGPLKIAFMAFQNNPFWIPVTEGAKAAADYLKDKDVQVDYVDLGDSLNAEAVIAGIESAVAQQYDGIVTVPIFDGTERAINEATEAGVPVFNIIAEGSVPSERLAFIGQDATDAGEQLGAFIAEKLGGKGKVGVITGYFGAVQHNQRMSGAVDYLKANAPEIEIIGPFENQDKAEVAYSLVQDMYTANPDLALVYVTAGGPVRRREGDQGPRADRQGRRRRLRPHPRQHGVHPLGRDVGADRPGAVPAGLRLDGHALQLPRHR